MKKEKDKRFVKFESKMDLNIVIILLALLTFFWAINNNISSINQRIDGLFISVNKSISELEQRIDSSNQRIDRVYTIVTKLDKGIVDMKTGIEARFASIEKRLTAIDIGISSLQPRDDSLKEPEPPGKPIPLPILIPEPESGPQTTPFQEGESGPQTTPYQSP